MQHFDIITFQLHTDVRFWCKIIFNHSKLIDIYFSNVQVLISLSSVLMCTPHPPSTCFQFVGYSDEVLDVKFLGKDDSHIVVATNSCQLKVFELLTNSCQILYGHTGR